MTLPRRLAAFIALLFGVLSIGAYDCFGDASPPPPAPSCPAGTHRYECKVTVRIGPPIGASQRCFPAAPGCFPDLLTAQQAAQSGAATYYMMSEPIGDQTVVQTTSCSLVSSSGTQSYYEPQDSPGACDAVEPIPDAGPPPAPDGGPGCLALTDVCTDNTDCCSGVCSEQGNCESCRMPQEGCVSDSECCSNVCSLNGCG